jgi:hypothetical protein
LIAELRSSAHTAFIYWIRAWSGLSDEGMIADQQKLAAEMASLEMPRDSTSQFGRQKSNGTCIDISGVKY